MKIFEDLNIKPGISTSQGLQKSEPGKARKNFRLLRKKYIDDVEEEEVVLYEAEGF